MRALITSLLICGVLVVLFLGLGSNMVQAQRGGEPTPTPRPTLPPRLPPAPGTRIPINDNLFITADEKGILYFVDRSGNPVSVISKDMKPPPGNTKPVIPLPQPYRSPVGGAEVRATAASKHSLNIPWGSFTRGFVLLPRDLNSSAGNTAAAISWFTHAGFHWDENNVFDSTSAGVGVKPKTPWDRFELLDVQEYWRDRSLGKAAAEWGELVDSGKPYNYNYCDKGTTDAFYCSQLVWREYFDYGVDLDSNYTSLLFCNPQNAVVSPDDIYYSPEIAINWDSRWSMSCTKDDYPWRGEYYSNTSLSGSAYVFCDSTPDRIDFDWGIGVPSGSLPADNFSVRWTRTLYFSAGNYRFHLAGDDGLRLWVDGNLIIDQWHDQSRKEYTADRYLSSGNHDLKVEYYEHEWDASVTLWWEQIQYKVFLPAVLKDSAQDPNMQPLVFPTKPPKVIPTPTRPPYPRP